MASALYRTFARRMLAPSQSTPTTAIDLAADTIKAVFVNVSGGGTLYSFSQTHEFYSDLTLGALFGNDGESATLAECPPLASLTSNVPQNGVIDAADTVFTTVPNNSNSPEGDALVLFKDTTTTTTSPLIIFIDGFTAVTFNGGNVTVQWDSGTNRIFLLVP